MSFLVLFLSVMLQASMVTAAAIIAGSLVSRNFFCVFLELCMFDVLGSVRVICFRFAWRFVCQVSAAVGSAGLIRRVSAVHLVYYNCRFLFASAISACLYVGSLLFLPVWVSRRFMIIWHRGHDDVTGVCDQLVSHGEHEVGLYAFTVDSCNC